MSLTENLLVTQISQPFTVHSAKGRAFEMENRPDFGLSFCISGQITYTMHGKEFVSCPGYAVILPRGGYYSLRGDKDGLFPLMNFHCVGLPRDTILRLPLKNSQACIRDFETLKHLFLFGENRLRIYSVFYDLLNKVFQEQTPQQSPLAPALRYLEEHLSDPGLSNAVLAAQCRISEVYFRKLFAQHYGQTPRQYILNIRIAKAKQLLTESPYTVTYVAEQCGFASLYHFCRVFRERTGVTPSQYAKENRIFRL